MSTGDYVFACLPITLIEVLWDRIVPHLQRVIDASAGEITIESTKLKALNGDSMFILICKTSEIIAVNLVEINTYESGLKALHIPVVGGSGAFEWGPNFLAFCKELAKGFGCTEMRGFSTRESWKRVLKDYGWVESHFVIKCMVD